MIICSLSLSDTSLILKPRKHNSDIVVWFIKSILVNNNSLLDLTLSSLFS